MASRRYCHLCGQPVRRYRLYRRKGVTGSVPDLVVCRACESAQMRCSLCGVPVAAVSNGHDGLCPDCWTATPSCLACDRPVGKTYVEIGDQRRISKSAVQFFLDWIAERIEKIKLAKEEERNHVLGFHRQAQEFWRKRLQQANAD